MIIRYPKMFDAAFIDSFRFPKCTHNKEVYSCFFILCANYLTKFIQIAEVHQAIELPGTQKSATEDETDDHREDYKPHQRSQSGQTWTIFQEFINRENAIRRKSAIHPRLVVSDADSEFQSTFEKGIKTNPERNTRRLSRGRKITLFTTNRKPHSVRVTTIVCTERSVHTIRRHFPSIYRAYITQIKEPTVSIKEGGPAKAPGMRQTKTQSITTGSWTTQRC